MNDKRPYSVCPDVPFLNNIVNCLNNSQDVFNHFCENLMENIYFQCMLHLICSHHYDI